MFRKPQSQTLKADHTSRISRCSVCRRRQIIENNNNNSKFKQFTSNSERYVPPQLQPVNPLPLQYPSDRQRYEQRNRNRGPNQGRVPNYNRRRQRIYKPEEANQVLDQ